MALTLEQLRAAWSKADDAGSSRPNNYYPFWNLAEGGQAVVRFLPDVNEDNPRIFVVEKLMHNLTIGGEEKRVPCQKMYGEDCPICKVSSAYYRENDKANGSKFWRKKQYIAQVLVIEDPLPPDDNSGETHEGKVRFVNMGFQLYNIIKDALESGELDEVPFAYEGGTNFIIKKSRQGDFASYNLSKFARRSTDLTDEEISEVEDKLIDLSTLLPANPGFEKTESMLEAALTGSSYDDDDDSGTIKFKRKSDVDPDDDDDDDEVEEKPKKTVKSSKKKTTNVVTEDDDDEFSNEAEEILAQLAARRSASAE